MTERLYHLDSYRNEFDATLAEIADLGGRTALVLDRTHFYPTSGGQPFDTGTLAGLAVVDVVAVDDTIYHIVDGDPAASLLGGTVHGVIDWPRRYDHMQQHSGQHLLSQTFYHVFGYETVSVHFGASESTLDLATPTLSEAELSKAEQFANQQVYANLPIRAYFVTDAELDQVPLRRAPKVRGRIRIVEIEAFDYSACGGTHCRRTGDLGPIKLLRQTRQKRQARVSFVCGQRALADYAEKHRVLAETAALFDNEVSQVPTLVARCQEETKAHLRRIDALMEQLLSHEVVALRQDASDIGGHHLIARIYTDRDVTAVKRLAAALIEEPNCITLLGSADDSKLTLVFARGEDVPLHMGDLLRATLRRFGGGGGGRPEFAQGGGVSAHDAKAVLDFAQAQIAG